jgi:hypothetical protein
MILVVTPDLFPELGIMLLLLNMKSMVELACLKRQNGKTA